MNSNIMGPPDVEVPKVYSDFCEEKTPPKPAARVSTNRIASAKTSSFDGLHTIRRHVEYKGINPDELSKRLARLTQGQHKSYVNYPSQEHRDCAIKTLRDHYSSFSKRELPSYKVYINYFDIKETYLVRVKSNLLRDVKMKLPIKGNYRLFFIHNGNECEEVEDDEAALPYIEKDGAFVIYCRVFPK